ncbi:MAG: hypothetical protein ABI847_18410, partial [Anaerolineales bacterium]
MVAQPSPPEPILPRGAQRALQGAWLILILPVVALYFAGLVQSWQAQGNWCDELGPDCTEAAVAQTLARIGLTPTSAGVIFSAFSDLGVPLGCLLIAAFIFLRRRDRLIALAISAALALYGPLINTSFIDGGLAALGLAALVGPDHAAFQVLLWFVIFTFPTGRFVPRWSWALLALGLIIFTLVYGLAPTSLVRPYLQIVPLIGLGLQSYRYRRVSSAVER